MVCMISVMGSTRIATMADGMFELVSSCSCLFGSISMADTSFLCFQLRWYHLVSTDIPLRLTWWLNGGQGPVLSSMTMISPLGLLGSLETSVVPRSQSGPTIISQDDGTTLRSTDMLLNLPWSFSGIHYRSLSLRATVLPDRI